jgi:hypothetical protein
MAREQMDRQAAVVAVLLVGVACWGAGLMTGRWLWRRVEDPVMQRAVARMDALSEAVDAATQRAAQASAAGRHGEAARAELESWALLEVITPEAETPGTREVRAAGVRLELAQKDRRAAQAWDVVVGAMGEE